MEKERLISILDEMPVAFLVLNENEELLYMNRSTLEVLKKSEAEIFGSPFSSLLSFDTEEDSGTFKTAIKQMLPGDEYETRILFDSGKRRLTGTLNLKKAVIERVPYYLGRIEDITTRLAYEKVLSEGIERIQKHSIETEEALTIIRNQNKELTRYKRMLLEELRIATVIQKTIMPHTFPGIPFGEFYGKTKQVHNLGGDYYDYLKFGEEKYGFFIADVSGHGVSAALITTMLKAHLAHLIKTESSPDSILSGLNILFSRILEGTGVFITAANIILDFRTGEMTYASAGHHAVFFYLTGQWTPIQEADISPVLGLDGKSKYKIGKGTLKAEDALLLFTDGIIEARNPNSKFWGQANLINTLYSNRSLPAEKLVKKCFQAVQEFCGGNDQNDDRTIFYIKKK